MDTKSFQTILIGIGFVLIGVGLFIYSFFSHSEIQKLDTIIDLEGLRTNVGLGANEKYARYLSNADFLNKKISKNKSLVIKRTSCVYIDYAYYNAYDLYKLTGSFSGNDEKNAALGNLHFLQNAMKDYTTCKNYNKYNDEITNILDNEQSRQQFEDENKQNLLLLEEEQVQEDNRENIEGDFVNKTIPPDEDNNESFSDTASGL